MIPLLRKNLIFFLLLNFNFYAQVTLTNSNLKANNTIITNNTIGFNSDQSLDISLTIQLETADNSINNTFGNLFLYYKKSENDSPTQVGYQSIVFVQNIPKTNFISNAVFTSIILYKNAFFANGGILYAEYKNNNNKTYQSNKISITGGSLTTIPTPPPSTNQSISTQNLKYSDNFPIVNSKLFVTADTPTYFDVDVYMAQNESNNSTINIYACEEGGSKRFLLKSVFLGGFISSYFSVKDIKINPTDLDFTKNTYVLKIEKRKYSSNLSTYSSTIDNLYTDNKAINIILVKPISYNTIADNQSLTFEQISKPFTSLSPWVDFTIPCNRRACIPIYDRRNVTIFKWQIKTQNSDWSDIYGETQKDYSPNKSFTENTYYRRVAFYNDGQYNLSNIISITLNNQSFENTICCNQDLPLATSQPKEITGNIPNLSNFTYQWQICTEPSYTTPVWSDITNATTQNYQHTFTQTANRGTLSTAFRRLTKTNTSVTSTSNTITIIRTTSLTETNPPIRRDGTTNPRSKPSNTSKVIVNEINNEAIENKIKDIDIYPNPVFNSFFIKGLTNINNINFFDSSGGKINLEKKQVSENLIEVDATKLSSGIFILKIDNSTYSKKIIKK